MKIKALIISFVFFFIGVLPFHANAFILTNEITTSAQSGTNQPNGIQYNILCPEDFVIQQIGIYTRSGSGGTHSIALYFPSFVTASNSITSTQGWKYFSIDDLPCSNATSTTFVINTSNTYYSYLLPNTATTTNIKVVRNSDNLILRYFLKLSANSATSSGSAIYLFNDNINGMTTEWECTASGDITNCLSIATSTLPNDQLISFGILFFIFCVTLLLGVMLVYPLYARK